MENQCLRSARKGNCWAACGHGGASAGGVIGGALEVGLIDHAGYAKRLAGIHETTLKILSESGDRELSPNEIAASLADARQRLTVSADTP